MSKITVEKVINKAESTDAKLLKMSEEFKVALEETLRKLEKKIVGLLEDYTKNATTAKQIDIDFALETRTQLNQLLTESGYYSNVEDALAKYSGIIKEVKAQYLLFGTKINYSASDSKILKELIKLDTAKFTNIAQTTIDQIYKSLIDVTLTPTTFNEAVSAVRSAIENTDMKKYAYTQMNTAYMDFFRRVNNITNDNAGFERVMYVGPIDKVTRPFCLKHVGEVMTKEEAIKLKNDAKESAYIYGGGWNCRHQWIGIPNTLDTTDIEQASKANVEKVEQEKKNVNKSNK